MSTEFYGFVLYIAAFVGSVVWLAWAYIPDSALSYMGIIYYPAKYACLCGTGRRTHC